MIPKVESMVVLLLPMASLVPTLADKCEVEFIESKYGCSPETDDLDSKPQKALYNIAPMSIEKVGDKQVNITLSDPPNKPSDERITGWNKIIPMTCTKSLKEFPNACSGGLGIMIMKNPKRPFAHERALAGMPRMLSTPDIAGLPPHVPAFGGMGLPIFGEIPIMKGFGTGLYFYSTYDEEAQKVHEKIEAVFLMGEGRKCMAELKLKSGECFGMKADRSPRSPQEVPTPPDLGEEVSPGFPKIEVKDAPGLGAGIIILIILIILAVGGGGAFFFLRRNKLAQEAARTAQVELS